MDVIDTRDKEESKSLGDVIIRQIRSIFLNKLIVANLNQQQLDTVMAAFDGAVNDYKKSVGELKKIFTG